MDAQNWADLSDLASSLQAFSIALAIPFLLSSGITERAAM